VVLCRGPPRCPALFARGSKRRPIPNCAPPTWPSWVFCPLEMALFSARSGQLRPGSGRGFRQGPPLFPRGRVVLGGQRFERVCPNRQPWQEFATKATVVLPFCVEGWKVPVGEIESAGQSLAGERCESFVGEAASAEASSHEPPCRPGRKTLANYSVNIRSILAPLTWYFRRGGDCPYVGVAEPNAALSPPTNFAATASTPVVEARQVASSCLNEVWLRFAPLYDRGVRAYLVHRCPVPSRRPLHDECQGGVAVAAGHSRRRDGESTGRALHTQLTPRTRN